MTIMRFINLDAGIILLGSLDGRHQRLATVAWLAPVNLAKWLYDQPFDLRYVSSVMHIVISALTYIV